jgi:hypothetical protein
MGELMDVLKVFVTREQGFFVVTLSCAGVAAGKERGRAKYQEQASKNHGSSLSL